MDKIQVLDFINNLENIVTSMTFYLRPSKFNVPARVKLEEGSVYLIKILVDKMERRVYKVSSQHIREINFSRQEPFIVVSSAEYVVEVKLYEQDQFRNPKILAQISFQKQNIIRDKHLQSEPSHTIATYDTELDPIEQSIPLKNQYMTKDVSSYSIQFEVKLDKYKKTLGKLKPNMHFIEELRFLDQDLQYLQRQSVNMTSRPRPSFLNKDQLFPQSQSLTKYKNQQKTKTELDTKIDSRVTANYIGSCYSKNVFSFLDRDKSEHKYTFVEPQYEY